MRDAEVPQVMAVLPEGVRDHEGEVVHNPAHERQYSFAGPRVLVTGILLHASDQGVANLSIAFLCNLSEDSQ